jgi:glutamate dehydrogenase (NAD(P)+)
LIGSHAGIPTDGARVVIQGFGNVGRYAALAAQQLGCKVIGVSDITGAIHSDLGFEVEKLIRHADENGGVAGYPDADVITSQELFALECEYLVPAAVGGVITGENAGSIRAKAILEGANGPTTGEAEAMLNEAGILVVPDVLANAGGVTVSYFEWVQDLENYFWSESEIVARLREIMNRALSEVIDISTKDGVDLRTAALMKGIRRVTEAKLARGVYP